MSHAFIKTICGLTKLWDISWFWSNSVLGYVEKEREELCFIVIAAAAFHRGQVSKCGWNDS